MADIDQSRFALIAVLTRAHEARPDDYHPPPTLLAMSDEGLRGYAAKRSLVATRWRHGSKRSCCGSSRLL